jgi:ABC-type transport system substrate-binding protein
MKKTQRINILQRVICVLFLGVLSACSQSPTAAPISVIVPSEVPAATKTPLPVNTNTPVPTATNTPEPTPIPGVQVYPISSLASSIPWLPLDESNDPMTVYYGFNCDKPPFDNAFVRQAFAAAVDREEIAKEAAGFKFRNVTPATSLTPPEVLGRDLYGAVGIPFDPARAKDLLKQAGYENVDSFPAVTLYVTTRGSDAPGAYYQMAKSIVGMWKKHLGINVIIKTFENFGGYQEIWATNPGDIYQLGWGVDKNDPDNILNYLFHSGGGFNLGNYNSKVFDAIVEKAAGLSNPLERQLLYIQAEQILTEDDAGVIPLFHTLFYTHP